MTGNEKRKRRKEKIRFDFHFEVGLVRVEVVAVLEQGLVEEPGRKGKVLKRLRALEVVVEQGLLCFQEAF